MDTQIDKLLILKDTLIEQGDLYGIQYFEFGRYHRESYAMLKGAKTDGNKPSIQESCALGKCPQIWPQQWRYDLFAEHSYGFTYFKQYIPVLQTMENAIEKNVVQNRELVVCSARIFFGLSTESVMHLFFPQCQVIELGGFDYLPNSSKANHVAEHIDRFVCDLINRGLNYA